MSGLENIVFALQLEPDGTPRALYLSDSGLAFGWMQYGEGAEWFLWNVRDEMTGIIAHTADGGAHWLEESTQFKLPDGSCLPGLKPVPVIDVEQEAAPGLVRAAGPPPPPPPPPPRPPVDFRAELTDFLVPEVSFAGSAHGPCERAV